jgi:hypothetical protein
VSYEDVIRRLHELDPDRAWETAACQDALAALDNLVAQNHQFHAALEEIKHRPIGAVEIATDALDRAT